MNAKFYSSAHGELMSAPGYGAWRWHALMGEPGKWYVVSLNLELDAMRGLRDSHFSAVVDDFGSLVLVK